MNADSLESGSRLLASTLHEVRTPIQTIISTTELLGDTALDQEQTEYVHQIEFSANVLLQLANDVLDFTKIRSKEFKLESIPYDVTALTEHVVDLVSIDAFNKGLEVITDIDYAMQCTVMGDPTRIQQIILNLVKNAVKFTEKGYVLIKLSHKNNNLVFQILDSGIGIPPEKQKLVFKEFYQVDASTTRRYGGTGLGLAICKNLVDVMGGKIGVRSNPKGGSNFWFTIPFAKANFGSTQNGLPASVAKAKILIVDNNRLSLYSFIKKLQSIGIWGIDGAASGEEAVDKLRKATAMQKDFDISFINISLPQTDGWKLASEIRADASIKTPRLFLMVTEGQMGKDAKKKMLDLFDGYLYKPVKKEQLFSLLAARQENPPQAEKQARVPPPDQQDIACGCTILIAEDHPVNRKLLHTFLERFGATVYLAENGEEAVRQIAEHPDTDIIFMDILMPVKSGSDATVELRSKDYKGIIIACTANNDPNDLDSYRKLGINDVLIKPYKRDAVKQILEKWKEVLAFPEAQRIVSLTETNNKAAEIWDIADFMDTTGGDKELAKSLMDDYLTQTKTGLATLKTELAKESPDCAKLAFVAHTLKGSSAAVSIHKLAAHGKQMEELAAKKDITGFEAVRTTFAVDFLALKQLVSYWKSAL